MQQQAPKRKWLGINWQISLNSGWGVLGLNLTLEAERDGRWPPTPLVRTLHTSYFPPEYQRGMEQALARERVVCAELAGHKGGLFQLGFPVLHSLGNWLGDPGVEQLERVRGMANFAIIFLEDTQLRPRASEASRQFNLLLAGSTWNTQILRKNGILNVETFLQGVDLSLFTRARRPEGNSPFVVFSGGKLEYRKGQDITVAAFRKFRAKHPDAILATAWHNPWPNSIKGISLGNHVTGQPSVDKTGNLDIVGWLEANGIPQQFCHDLGPVPNFILPKAYAQAHVAVLPNRCEGGTNLVAMECLASGVPTILSANTGHLDLIDERHCYPLTKQDSVKPLLSFTGTEGWGESDVDEIVELLERVYRDRNEAEKRGAEAARFMQGWSWRRRFEQLVGYLEQCT